MRLDTFCKYAADVSNNMYKQAAGTATVAKLIKELRPANSKHIYDIVNASKPTSWKDRLLAMKKYLTSNTDPSKYKFSRERFRAKFENMPMDPRIHAILHAPKKLTSLEASVAAPIRSANMGPIAAPIRSAPMGPLGNKPIN